MTPDDHAVLTDCDTYQRNVQAVLDREQDASALQDPHPLRCPNCAEFYALALQLRLWESHQPSFQLPVPVQVQITTRLETEWRRLWWRRWLLRGGAGVAILLLGTIGWLKSPSGESLPPEPVPVPTLAPTNAPPLPSLEDPVSEANSVLLAMTRQTADQTFRPAQQFYSWTESLSAPPEPELTLTSASESLLNVPQSARASLDPVANGTKRAVNRLLRDLSAFTPSKPKS